MLAASCMPDLCQSAMCQFFFENNELLDDIVSYFRSFAVAWVWLRECDEPVLWQL